MQQNIPLVVPPENHIYKAYQRSAAEEMRALTERFRLLNWVDAVSAQPLSSEDQELLGDICARHPPTDFPKTLQPSDERVNDKQFDWGNLEIIYNRPVYELTELEGALVQNLRRFAEMHVEKISDTRIILEGHPHFSSVNYPFCLMKPEDKPFYVVNFSVAKEIIFTQLRQMNSDKRLPQGCLYVEQSCTDIYLTQAVQTLLFSEGIVTAAEDLTGDFLLVFSEDLDAVNCTLEKYIDRPSLLNLSVFSKPSIASPNLDPTPWPIEALF